MAVRTTVRNNLNKSNPMEDAIKRFKRKKPNPKAPDLYREEFVCADLDNCYVCVWGQKGDCMRELLTEDEIDHIIEKING